MVKRILAENGFFTVLASRIAADTCHTPAKPLTLKHFVSNFGAKNVIKIILSAFMLSMLAGCVVVTELPESITERIIREHEAAIAKQQAEQPATAESQVAADNIADEKTDMTPMPASEEMAFEQPAVERQSMAKQTEMPAPVADNVVKTDDAVQPGQCYVQAAVYPKPVKRQQEVITKESSKAITVIPASISEGYQQVVTKQSHTTYQVTPPKFKKITEKIMVKPAMQKNRVIPAKYETREVAVVVEEATAVLEPCVAAGSAYAHSTGVRSFCAKEIPAKTQMIKKQVLVEDERVESYQEPAQYETVSRWELVQEARVEERETEPEVAQVAYQEVVSPEQIDERQTSPVKTMLPVLEYLGEPQIVTRRAVCDNELDNDLLKRLQTALNAAGYRAGETDGYIGEQTISALTRYQKDNGLAVGAITYESLDKLLK